MMISQIQQEVKQIFENSKGSHDWEHTERVLNNALHIAKVENADIEIITISALMHDIAREHQDKSKGKICHAELGAELAEKILQNLGLEEYKIEQVKHCIKTHRFRGTNEPKTIEAKVLYDADKLDSIGAIGIGRSFVFAGEHGAKVHNNALSFEEVQKTESYTNEDTAFREFAVKLIKIKNKMLTKEGRKLAEKRHIFMTKFFEQINNEVKGVI